MYLVGVIEKVGSEGRMSPQNDMCKSENIFVFVS